MRQGNGSVSCMSISLGQKNLKRAKEFLENSVLLILVISFLMVVLFLRIEVQKSHFAPYPLIAHSVFPSHER